MKSTLISLGAVLFACLLTLMSCASQQKQVNVGPETGEKTLHMTASSFKFVPDNIKARQGDTILFKIENISGTEHNFTIFSPNGRVLQSMDIPPKKTVSVEVHFPETGDYRFHCDEPFHALLGMDGKVEVVR